jgi:hypothetical protein
MAYSVSQAKTHHNEAANFASDSREWRVSGALVVMPPD